MRVKRGTLPSTREGGRLWVLLRTDPTTEPERPHDRTSELIATLREQLQAERRANEENRRIIAALTSRIPQLEAPRERPESPQTVEEEPERPAPRSDAPGPQAATEGTETAEEAPEMAISVVRAELERVREQAAALQERAAAEREAALRLEEELEAERSKGFWSRLFGG